MSNFNFEKNLEHQDQAIQSTIKVFDGIDMIMAKGTEKEFSNPVFDIQNNSKYKQNIRNIQSDNQIKIDGHKTKSHIIDIMMETGTGKTYTYTKTIFELNKYYGIFKFVILVPTLPIKAGTIDFLKSSQGHFREQYGKIINLHIVESKKGNKSKKSFIPPAINNFVNAGNFDRDKIQVMIINAGMVNSYTMQEKFDKIFFDKYDVPFDAIASTKPILIIDEPHKFDQENKTWLNLEKMNPKIILRYGATFKENENLIYTLSAIDSFNRNLVKGVIGHITEFDSGKDVFVKFINSNGVEATFELIKKDKNNTKKSFKLAKNESLEKVHSAMQNLVIEKLNKTTVILSNGLELKKGNSINPYSYAETLQETMIQKAIRNHFEQERELLTREVKIKPLTLFFIDNIQEYRDKEGYIKITVEKYIKSEVENLLKTEKDIFYRNYLEKTLKDITKTHGGYFAIDKKETDEMIEKEINEILHDKQAILSLDNPRRFIFSKWTLREGWDNPNIFQICKLRSSGSEISKLQEVGRGLRLPVNQYGNRVKNEQFYLNYFVDFTENDFVEKLVNEINEKSGAISKDINPTKLTEEIILQITEKYSITEDDLLQRLDNDGVITRTNDFKENGFDYIKINYPLIFGGVDSNKIKKANTKNNKMSIRVEKYTELKELWEKLNQKVILEYKIENESEFQEIFVNFLQAKDFYKKEGLREKTAKINFENGQAMVKEERASYDNNLVSLSTMKYGDFLRQLAQRLNINIKTIHQAFIKSKIDISHYLNQSTINSIKQNFDDYLMYQATNKFEIEYQKVKSSIHPTAITDIQGKIKEEIDSYTIGSDYSLDKVAEKYLFEQLFYDSELEKENIKESITDIVVFTKIPKNSIKIPVAGGKSYSPDFAYVINYKDQKKKLHFIVETKNTDEDSLRNSETQKIRHSERFFGDTIKIQFKTQFSNQKMIDLIGEVWSGEEI